MQLNMSFAKYPFTGLQQHQIDGIVQRDTTPLLTNWSYVSFALSHRYNNINKDIARLAVVFNALSAVMVLIFCHI